MWRDFSQSKKDKSHWTCQGGRDSHQLIRLEVRRTKARRITLHRICNFTKQRHVVACTLNWSHAMISPMSWRSNLESLGSGLIQSIKMARSPCIKTQYLLYFGSGRGDGNVTSSASASSYDRWHTTLTVVIALTKHWQSSKTRSVSDCRLFYWTNGGETQTITPHQDETIKSLGIRSSTYSYKEDTRLHATSMLKGRFMREWKWCFMMTWNNVWRCEDEWVS